MQAVERRWREERKQSGHGKSPTLSVAPLGQLFARAGTTLTGCAIALAFDQRRGKLGAVKVGGACHGQHGSGRVRRAAGSSTCERMGVANEQRLVLNLGLLIGCFLSD